MKKKSESKLSIIREVQELKSRLCEAEQTIEAIQGGHVDALVVHTKDKSMKVFTVQGAETAYRIMVENMNEGALTLDDEGVILYANAKFCSLLGFPLSFISGKAAQTFVADSDREPFSTFLAKSVSGSKVHHDFTFVKKNNMPLPVYLSSAPLEIQSRHDTCVIVTDLTERKRIEKRLTTLNNELERKVKKRTAELQQRTQELERANRQYQKLTESLEERIAQRTALVRDLAKALTLAEQRERRRLSQVLHEDLQQILFTAKLRFDLLEDEITHLSHNAREDFLEIKRLTEKALKTSSTLAVELNPPVLKEEGLDAAIRWLAYHMGNRYGLKVKTTIKENFRTLNEDMRMLLIQLVRELLFNIIKHAQTKEAMLHVEKKTETL